MPLRGQASRVVFYCKDWGDSMYVAYRCNICGAEFIMLTEQLKEAEIAGRYIACPFGHRSINQIGRYDDLRQCMETTDTYTRDHGAVHQTRWEK